MHIFNAIGSVAAFAALVTPVFSVPVAEPASVVVRTGPGSMGGIAHACYQSVQQQYSNITATIQGVANPQGMDIAAAIVPEIQIIADLVARLGADLQAKIALGGLVNADVQACMTTVAATVNLYAYLLSNIHSTLPANVNINVFAALVQQLATRTQFVVNILANLGVSGAISFAPIDVAVLVAGLNAGLAAYINACRTLGIVVPA